MRSSRTAPLLFAAAVLLLSALTAACTSEPGKPGAPGAPGRTIPQLRDPNLETTHSRALDAARALWTARGATNYDMRFNWTCYCDISVVDLEIRDGSVTSREGTDRDAFRIDQETIPALFAIIEDAINQRAVSLEVTYHPTLGYPLRADIDYALNIIDEELGFTIHQLTLH